MTFIDITADSTEFQGRDDAHSTRPEGASLFGGLPSMASQPEGFSAFELDTIKEQGREWGFDRTLRESIVLAVNAYDVMAQPLTFSSLSQ